MKRIISTITAIILCLCLLTVAAFAASASATLTGPDSVQAGETVTVTLNLTADEVYGMSGKLSYDSSKLTMLDAKTVIAGDWLVEFNGNIFVVYDNTMENPLLNTTAALFTVTFEVKDPVVGETVTVSCTDLVATDGTKDIEVGTVTYTGKIVAAPEETTQATEPSTQPATRPTASATEPATEATEPSTEPVTEPSTAPTAEPTAGTEATVPSTEATQAPTEATQPDDSVCDCPEDCSCRKAACWPWWWLILVGVICLVIGYVVGTLVEKKKAQKKAA